MEQVKKLMSAVAGILLGVLLYRLHSFYSPFKFNRT